MIYNPIRYGEKTIYCMLRTLSAILGLLPFMTMAQDLDQYKWNKRVVILSTADLALPIYREQLETLEMGAAGLEDRKIKILTVDMDKLEEGYLITPRSDFEFILIGLDGRIKFRTDKLVALKHLFDIIDGMPMRRSEMEDKRKTNR